MPCRFFLLWFRPRESRRTVNPPEIDKRFEELRNAEHGSIIEFDPTGSGELVEGIVIELGDQRPAGYDSGIFVADPSDRSHIYYLDPEASRQQGRLVSEALEVKTGKQGHGPAPEDMLKEFEYMKEAPDIKRGGGATGEANSKSTGLINLG